MQEGNPQAFYEKVSQYYGSDSFKEWMEKKQKKAKASSLTNESGLFDNE